MDPAILQMLLSLLFQSQENTNAYTEPEDLYMICPHSTPKTPPTLFSLPSAILAFLLFLQLLQHASLVIPSGMFS